jgi:hypothetical protein
MAKKAWDVRKIPKSDKAKRSLYMSPTYMKNLKGKAVNTKWVGEKKDGAQSLKSEYEYQQSSGKNPQVRGRRKQVYKDPISTQSVDVKKRHKTKKTKEGGYDTHRYTKVEDRYKHQLGEGGYAKDKDGEGFVRETQNKKGKVTKREYLLNKLKAKEKEKAKKKKTVKQKTTTYQGKKGDTMKPKVRKKKYFTNNQTGKKELAPPPGYVPEKKQAKRETDSTVQKQIQSGFGDWASSDDFGKKMKSDFAKKKKSMLSGYGKKKKSMLSDYDKKKREMEASYAKKKKSMGG